MFFELIYCQYSSPTSLFPLLQKMKNMKQERYVAGWGGCWPGLCHTKRQVLGLPDGEVSRGGSSHQPPALLLWPPNLNLEYSSGNK